MKISGKYFNIIISLFFAALILITGCARVKPNHITKAIEEASQIRTEKGKTELDSYNYLSKKIYDFSLKEGYNSLNNLRNIFDEMSRYSNNYVNRLCNQGDQLKAYKFIKNSLDYDFKENGAPQSNIRKQRHLGFLAGMSYAQKIYEAGHDNENILSWLDHESTEIIFSDLSDTDSFFYKLFQYNLRLKKDIPKNLESLSTDEKIETLEKVYSRYIPAEEKLLALAETTGKNNINTVRRELESYEAFPPSIRNPIDVLSNIREKLFKVYLTKFHSLNGNLYTEAPVTLYHMDINEQYLKIIQKIYDRLKIISERIPESEMPEYQRKMSSIKEVIDVISKLITKDKIIERSKKFAKSWREIIPDIMNANIKDAEILNYYQEIQRRIKDEILAEQPDMDQWMEGIKEYNYGFDFAKMDNLEKINLDALKKYIQIVRKMIIGLKQKKKGDLFAAGETFRSIYNNYGYVQADYLYGEIQQLGFDYYLEKTRQSLESKSWDAALTEIQKTFFFAENENDQVKANKLFISIFKSKRQDLIKNIEKEIFAFRFKNAISWYDKKMEWNNICIEKFRAIMQDSMKLSSDLFEETHSILSGILDKDKQKKKVFLNNLYNYIEKYLASQNKDKLGYVYYCYDFLAEHGPLDKRDEAEEMAENYLIQIIRDARIEVRWEGWNFQREKAEDVSKMLSREIEQAFYEKNLSQNSLPPSLMDAPSSSTTNNYQPVYWTLEKHSEKRPETVILLKGSINKWVESLQSFISPVISEDYKQNEVNLYDPQDRLSNQFLITSKCLKRDVRFEYMISGEAVLIFSRRDDKSVDHVYRPDSSFKVYLDQTQNVIEPMEELIYSPVNEETISPSEVAREKFRTFKEEQISEMRKKLKNFVLRQDIMEIALLEPARNYVLHGEPKRALDFYVRYLILNGGDCPRDCPEEYRQDIKPESLEKLFSFSPAPDSEKLHVLP